MSLLITNAPRFNALSAETGAHFQELNRTQITMPQVLSDITAQLRDIINDPDRNHISEDNRQSCNPNFTPEIKRLMRE